MSEFNPWKPNPRISFESQLAAYRATLKGGVTYVSGQMTSGLRQALASRWATHESGHLTSLRVRLNNEELRFVRDVVQVTSERRVFAPFELDENFPGLPAIGWGPHG